MAGHNGLMRTLYLVGAAYTVREGVVLYDGR
jgi:hypothetical protein